MPTPPAPYLNLANQIIQRYREHTGKSLLDVYQGNPDFLKLDPDSLEYLFTQRDQILNVLNDPLLEFNLLNLFVDEALQFTYENNQFIQLSPHEKEIFIHLYQVYLQGIKRIIQDSPSLPVLEADMSRLVTSHFQDLRANISHFFDNETAHFVHENLILKKAVCSEYSPEFQAEMLGIEPANLLEPVLDLGCGKSGQLVRYLNAQGIQAVGIDRLVDPVTNLFESDWFEFNLAPGSWGTIISHMAFSNHFIFNHRYQKGDPERYARQYIKLLSSLKDGGVFYYSPGLPFIEPFLPADQYQVTRAAVNLKKAGAFHISQEPGWYVARVMKQKRAKK
jgi:hypothetical protein